MDPIHLRAPHTPAKRSTDQSSFVSSNLGAPCPDHWCVIEDLGYSEREKLLPSPSRIFETPEHLAGRESQNLERSGPATPSSNYGAAHDTLSKEQFFNALYTKINGLLVPKLETSGPENQFLPWDDLKALLDRKIVEGVLTQVGLSRELHDEVCGGKYSSSRVQILATLILIDFPGYLKSFLDHNIFDDSLPLRKGHAVFAGWNDRGINYFCEKQYVVLSPCFNFARDRLRHYRFYPSIRMPFLDLQKFVNRGRDGTISNIRIHDGHYHGESNQQISDRTGKICALKRFFKYDEFVKERDALEHFSGPNCGHDHLARLLLSYQQGSEYFMIFDWAETDLGGFWEQYISDPTSQDDVHWIIQQSHGMAQGLSKVHGDDHSSRHSQTAHIQNRGRHGDIKPANILCFNQSDGDLGRLRLVVADFTLMRFHSPNSLGVTKADGLGCSLSYRPPEKDMGDKFPIDQPYDVWTLGCVYLEFLTWHLLGHQAVHGRCFRNDLGQDVQSFQEVRINDKIEKRGCPEDKFFEVTGGWLGISTRGRVKDSVTKWFHFLRRHDHSSQAIHDFLDLIETHMLLPNPKHRWKMCEIAQELGRISARCSSDKIYCLKGLPHSVALFEKDFPPLYTTIQSGQIPSITIDSILQSRTFSAGFSDSGVLEEVFEDLVLPEAESASNHHTERDTSTGSHRESKAFELKSSYEPPQSNEPDGSIDDERRVQFHDELAPSSSSIISALRSLRESPRSGAKDLVKKLSQHRLRNFQFSKPKRRAHYV